MLYFIGAVALSFLSGAFCIIFIVLYFLYKYRDDLFQRDQKPQVEYEKNQLGNLLRHNLHNGRGISTLGEKESCCFVNVLFAFIFREWRDTNQLQKWVLKKINIEFLEFMETKTASRLLNGLKIHDVSLGTNFPVFHSAKIKEPFSFTDNELPDNVVLELDMEYLGGFYLAIDVDLVFGKTAFLSVRIAYVKGRIRVHFGRQPCTHWSLCFVEEPEIKFDVETSFETRQLPQLTSLIVNQIRRTIRRKHTFPQYKMRYNPFFSFQHPEPSPFDGFIGEIPIQPATLEVCVASATRLLISPRGEKEKNSDSPNYVVFATLSVNADSCVGKPIFNSRSSHNAAGKNGTSEIGVQPADSPSTSKAVQPNHPKAQSTTFDSLQRSLFGAKKDAKAEIVKKLVPSSSQVSKTEESTATEKEPEEQEMIRTDSVSSSGSSSSSGPSYVMVALNFGATLREETRDDGQKAVVVENITEHNVNGQSGMKNGDTVVELNGIVITSLSQAITTIEKVRAKKEPFRFKVRRSRQDPGSTSLSRNVNAVATDSDKSNTSLDTESDHSDVESADYQDFVNISFQVAELHMQEGPKTRRARSSSSHVQSSHNAEGSPRSRSATSSNDANSADAPYMTLVSSPTPTTSSQSLKDIATGGNEVPSSSGLQQKVNKDLVKKKLDKMISPRSRSESPPFFRRSSPKKSTPPKKQNEKGESAKKELPKRSSSPTPSLLDTLFPELNDSSKTRGAQQSAEKGSPSKTVENLNYARVDNDPEAQLYKTSLVNSNQHEYSWNSEKFTFNLKEQHRFLNIKYWVQQVGKQGIIRTKSPQIVAYISVPLCEIEMYCRGITSRRVTRRFPLSAPNELPPDNKWFLNDPVSQRTSFREKYCYGDTTLTVKLLPNQRNKNNSSNHLSSLDSAGMYIPDEDGNGIMTKEILRSLSQKTGTDYLLSSATPKGQTLLVSRQTQTGERKHAPSFETESDKETQQASDHPTESSTETTSENLKVQEKVSLTQMLKGFLHKPQKVQHSEEEDPSTSEEIAGERENAHCDVVVGVITNRKSGLHHFELVKFSKSTKCSHCHSKLWMKTGFQCTVCQVICHKRCVEKFKQENFCRGSGTEGQETEEQNQHTSTATDNFVVVDSTSEANGSTSNSDSDVLQTAALCFRNKILDLTSPAKDDDDSDTNLRALRKKRYLLSKNSGDLLAVNAKEMGRDLHRDLPLSERKRMLEGQTQKVENELHSEIREKDHLLVEQKLYGNTTLQYRKLEKKILKADERLQALTLLLLHYRAGLEDCEFETTEEGMILSDDEDEKYGAVGSKSVTSALKDAGNKEI